MRLALLGLLLLLGGSNGIAAVAAAPRPAPMPPTFSSDNAPEQVLERYPLDKIDRQAAFSHHGSANRTVVLANGKEGSIYDVGDGSTHRIYTLVFDDRGVVIDVLYYDHSRYAKHGLSALQLQSTGIRTEAPSLGPGPAQ